MHPAHCARQRRRQRDPRGADPGLGKQRAQLAHRHAANVGVARVVDAQVVPQHGAARGEPVPHLRGQRLPRGAVEQRAKYCRLHDQVLAPGLDGYRLRVAFDQAQGGGQHAPCMRRPFGQQLDAGQALGQKSEPQQFEQVATGSTADFDRLFVGQVRPSCPVKAAQHGALPLLQRLPDVGLKEAVARGHAVAGGIARRHRIAVVLGAGHRFDVRRGACRTAFRKRSASTG